jgi:hypothetical protein
MEKVLKRLKGIDDHGKHHGPLGYPIRVHGEDWWAIQVATNPRTLPLCQAVKVSDKDPMVLHIVVPDEDELWDKIVDPYGYSHEMREG